MTAPPSEQPEPAGTNGEPERSSLGLELRRFASEQLDQLAERHLPELEVPRMFAGHRVGADVTADLLYAIGLLREAGTTQVAGVAIDDAIVRVLDQVDGPGTNTFFSYRVAETLLADGGLHGPAFAALSTQQQESVVEATDSSSFIELLDEVLPNNYAAVLARCELARQRLGLIDDRAVLDALIERSAALLAANPYGFLDDDANGTGRYDIYTVDIYLFLAPLAEQLGELWLDGLASVLDLVNSVASPNGAAVCWGRSTGALALCHQIELAGLALSRELTAEPEHWRTLAANATAHLPKWYRGGLITAHQHKNPFRYRGPARRLQMTLDTLGKLAWSAPTLAGASAGVDASELSTAFAPRDRLIELDEGAAIWSHRSRGLAFAMPFIGGAGTDYLSAPHQPGLVEVPVDSTLVTGVPTINWFGKAYTPTGRPARLRHDDASIDVEHEGWDPMVELTDRDVPGPVPGRRRAHYRVEDGGLVVDEDLSFETPPEAISLQIAETPTRPLRVQFTTEHPHLVDRIDVNGLAEYRSFWGELTTVHQIDLEPAREIRFRWELDPKLRVVMTALGHHYTESIYEHLRDSIWTRSFDTLFGQVDPALLATIDALHLHWPEWAFADAGSLVTHERIIGQLQTEGVPIIWTAHNLTPHFKQPEVFDEIYGAWALAADAVIHHTEWARERVANRYRFRPDARHAVIPHGHWGGLIDRRVTRDEAAEELGLAPAAIRLGVIGAPRVEKDVQLVIDAVHASARTDIQLCCWSGQPDLGVPDDERIVVGGYDLADRATYDLRISACDALVFPFTNHDMLATGTVADAVGHGIGALITDWPFLVEYLGEAGIRFDSSIDGLRSCIDGLDRAVLDRAAEASAALRPLYEWAELARQTEALIRTVAAPRP